MESLQTAELILEPLTAAHAASMFPLLSDPALYHYLDHGPPPSVEHLRGVYEKLEHRASPDGTEVWLNWVVRLSGGGPLGFVQATLVSDHTAWVAFVIGSAQWGSGYAYAAAQAMLRHLAADYGSRSFLASVERENARSINLLGRLGFAQATPETASTHDLGPTELLFVASPPV